MAEFQEVMKQAKRMCGEFRSQKHELCYDICPISLLGRLKNCSCAGTMKIDSELLEKIVMDWATKHPEPRYPTWNEWYKATFPNSNFHTIPCPSMFYKICETSNYHGEVECYECRNSPIPADIAEKLGIKPIGGNEDA